MERVSIIKGSEDTPILLVAPHGAAGDDDNTAELTETIAQHLGCWAVINRGFERATKYDYFADKADCNNVEHCQEDVVRQEFLEPINRAVNSILEDCYDANIFMIHGMSNHYRKLVKDDSLDMILGFGAAITPPGTPLLPHSCSELHRNAFIYLLDRNGINVYKGKAGGKFAAAARKNLNQYYRKWDYNEDVHSMQIEIVKALRADAALNATAENMATVFDEYLEFIEKHNDDELPSYFRKGWESIPNNTPEY
jgi:hypothetical protein